MPSDDEHYDYTDGASAVEISRVLSETQAKPRTRRDSQVGSAYEGDEGGAVFDGYGSINVPSSVTSMHHERMIDWGRDRRLSTASRTPQVGRGTSITSRYHSHRRDSTNDVAVQDDDDDDDDELGNGDEPSGSQSVHSRASRSKSYRKRRAESPQPRSSGMFDSIATMFSRAPESPTNRRLSISRRSSGGSRSRRPSTSRRSSRAGSDYAVDIDDEDADEEERWGYSSGEELSDSEADSQSLLEDGDSMYIHSDGGSRSHSPTSSLPLLTGLSDAVFGEADTRIDMGDLEADTSAPPPGPPSRQSVYIADEDMTVRFTGYEIVMWRQWVWNGGCVASLGILGLVGLWGPRTWLRWVAREKAFESLGEKGSGPGLVVVEVIAFSNYCTLCGLTEGV